jgi:hypothetical protein
MEGHNSALVPFLFAQFTVLQSRSRTQSLPFSSYYIAVYYSYQKRDPNLPPLLKDST